MDGVLLALRVLLALVLVVAGTAKLADRPGARAAVTGFGVPDPLAGPIASGLPWLELAAAVLLIPSATARGGAVLALVLMLAFSAAITRSILRGEAPDCHCFGALHSEPAGPRTLVRNLALGAGAAVAVAAGPGASATGWIGRLSGAGLIALGLGVLLIVAVAAGSAFALRLLRRNGELLLRIDSLEDALGAGGLPLPSPALPTPTAGLPIGADAPAFALPGLDGETVTLAALRDRAAARRDGAADLLLVFTDPSCGPCAALMPQIAAWQRETPGGVYPVVISRGAVEANLTHAREHALSDLLLQSEREIDESFGVAATPSAVIVSRDGTVASAVHSGEEQIRALVGGRSPVALPVHHHEPGPGRPAPEATLRSLDGGPVALADVLSGRETLLVFWDPACGFCARMLEALRELDRADRAASHQLVVISTGDVAGNRAMGLSAPILLDDSFDAGRQVGASGTPSAVRVDAHGRVSSPVAVGADAVLALARGGRSPVAA